MLRWAWGYQVREGTEDTAAGCGSGTASPGHPSGELALNSGERQVDWERPRMPDQCWDLVSYVGGSHQSFPSKKTIE